MSLKDNFNQAVKELLKKDGLVGSDLSKNAKQKSELDRYLETPPTASPARTPSAPAVVGEDDIPPMPAEYSPRSVPEPAQSVSAAIPTTPWQSPQSAQIPTPLAPSTTSSRPVETPYFETEETTVISRNTIIDGNIRSFANIAIEGSVKGDVQITKNANLSGKLVGDLECNNATMLG
ncbi:MAG: hypothetical protein RR540_08300 [Oscillospiraceae bacterium]